MKGFDFGLVGKVFCDGFHVNINKAGAFIGLQSGKNVHAFVAPLPLIKALHKSLGQKIEAYEQKYGVIDDSGVSTGIKSPMQP